MVTLLMCRNLVGAYFHGTNWYASSMLTSVEPWSGNYNTLPVVWATAHVTQFTKVKPAPPSEASSMHEPLGLFCDAGWLGPAGSG